MTDVSVIRLNIKSEKILYGEEGDGYGLLYDDEKQPSIIVTILLAIQALEVKLLNVIWLPLLLTNSLCIHPDDPAQLKIISLVLFSSGLSTIIFNSFGFRLPVLMLPNPRYYNRVRDILNIERKCPGAGDIYAMGHYKRTLEWENRMQLIQGGFIAMSLLQVFVGISGITQLIDSVLSNPLVFIPATIMIGLSYSDVLSSSLLHAPLSHLASSGAKDTEVNSTPTYCIIIITVAVILTSAFMLKNMKCLVPSFSFTKGCEIGTLKAFQLFPILIANFFGLLIYPVMYRLLYGTQNSNALFPNEHVLDEAELNSSSFLLHKPFEFGWPEINLQLIIGLLPDALINILTSMLIYRATRFIYDNKFPSKKLTSKAIVSEGIVNLASGLFGLISTSSVANIGIMKLTKVASKWVMRISGLFLILISIYSPAVLSLSKISLYHLQAINFILAALVTAVGLVMLQKVNINSTRTFTVIGISLYAGIVLPKVISVYDESTFTLLALLIRLMSSSIVICICTSVLMDSLLPGKDSSLKEEMTDCDQNNTKRKDLSFCEEVVAVCF